MDFFRTFSRSCACDSLQEVTKYFCSVPVTTPCYIKRERTLGKENSLGVCFYYESKHRPRTTVDRQDPVRFGHFRELRIKSDLEIIQATHYLMGKLISLLYGCDVTV